MLYRAQVVLKHRSGLPKDNASNVLWFRNAAAGFDQAAAETIAERVRDFFTITNGGNQTAPLSQYLSPSLLNTGHEVRIAPIVVETGEDARGRGFPPLHTEVFDFLTAPNSFDPIPSEVSLCGSFKNMSSGAIPPARRRGRIFLGPLGHVAMATVANVRRPHADVRGNLLQSMKYLRDWAEPAIDWVIYSRPFEGRFDYVKPNGDPMPDLPARAGSTTVVTDVWVDNAFDTQRRRGEAATVRETA